LAGLYPTGPTTFMGVLVTVGGAGASMGVGRDHPNDSCDS
jgi:hypothetical protein